MGFETLLLLCDVLRRPGRFRRVLVCVLCLLIYRGCGSARGRRVAGAGTGGAREAEQILARAFQ